MKVLGRLWRRFRPAEGRFIFLLLLLQALAAGWGVAAAKWVPGDALFWHSALVGTLLGRLLGNTRLRGVWGALLLLIAGGLYVGAGVTQIPGPLGAAIGAAWSGDWAQGQFWLQEVAGRSNMLAQEMGKWAYSWIGQSAPPGPVVALTLMALILWGAAAFAGWSIARGRSPLVAALPLGAGLSLSVFLGAKGGDYLILFVATLVMMMPLATLRRQERAWEARQVSYSEEFYGDTLQVALACVIVFVFAALLLPSLRVQALADWFWQRMAGPEATAGQVLERTFPGTRPASWGGSRAAGAVLPREHLLGSGGELQRTVVMLVSTDDPPPVPTEFVPEQAGGVAHYWRGRTYSEYIGTGWKEGPLQRHEWPAFSGLGPPERTGRRPLRQTFRLLVPSENLLYAAAEPYSVDQPVTVGRRPGEEEVAVLEGGATAYQVLSLVPQVTAPELEEAGGEYPAEIAARYLELPPALPGRVADLARKITLGARTPYARALALERYLRAMPYDLQVAGPPEGQDVVDYFLFDLQRGYCDYYASAMVVMARAVGIPARLAVGYATGRYEPSAGHYVVTAADAHAWPELYFPKYGWIPFEPTAGRPALTRPAEEAGEESLPAPAAPPERSWWVQFQVEARLAYIRWRWWVFGAVALLVLAWVGRRAWRWRPLRLDARGRTALCYWQLREWTRPLGVQAGPSDTAAEFTTTLQETLRGRQPRWEWARPWVQSDVQGVLAAADQIATTYERLSYAPQAPGQVLLRRAWQLRRPLRLRLWRLWALSRPAEG